MALPDSFLELLFTEGNPSGQSVVGEFLGLTKNVYIIDLN